MSRTRLLSLLAIMVATVWFAPAAQADPDGYLVCHEKGNGGRTLLVVGGINSVLAHHFGHGEVTEWESTADEVIQACS